MNRQTLPTTSRQRVMDAIEHRAPDRIPHTLYVDDDLRARLKRDECHDALAEIAAVERDNDTVRILWDIEHQRLDARTFYDSFGVRWARGDVNAYFFEDPPMNRPDPSMLPRIKLLPDSEARRIRDIRSKNPDRFIYYQFTMTFGERMWAMRGFNQYLMDLLEEPRFVHEALDILMQMHFCAIDELAKLPIDGVTFGDDFGSQRGLMISPELFREFFKPRLRQMYGRVAAHGLVVGAHSDGDNLPIIPDLIEIGLQVFHPVQPECMDLRTLKREFGKDLTFRGGIGVQRSISTGTADQVKAEVFESARALGSAGGYLMESCKPLPPETPVANVLAFLDAIRAAREYRFG